MADVVRTPQKRKDAFAKVSTPKIPKLESAKTPVKSETPKQKLVLNSNKKSGTGQMKANKEKVTNGKPEVTSSENPEENWRTRQRRKRQLQGIKKQINSDNKEIRKLTIQNLETKIQALECKSEKTKTCLRNLRVFRRLKDVAEGKIVFKDAVQKQGSETEMND